MRHSLGLTLIELIIGLSIIGIIAGLGLTTVSSILRSATKTSIFNNIKQNGDLATETMVRSVRSAIDVCTTSNRISLYLNLVNCQTTLQSPTTVFECTLGTDTSNGAVKKDGIPLTNESPSNPSLGVKVVSCNFSASTTVPKRVVIDFVLSQGAGLPSAPEYQVQIPFRTEVTLRNF